MGSATESLVDAIAHREAVTSLGTTTGKYLATIGSAHAMTEAMLVSLLQVRGLKCTFHCLIMMLFNVLRVIAREKRLQK